MSISKIIVNGVKIVAGAVAVYAAYKIISSGRNYLKRNNADLKKLDNNTVLLFEEYDKGYNLKQRIIEIKELLSSSSSHKKEAGALLFCSTYERVLREECKDLGLEVTEKHSLLKLAKELRNRKQLSREQYLNIKNFTSSIRNPIMHGEFDKLDCVHIQNLDNYDLNTVVFNRGNILY